MNDKTKLSNEQTQPSSENAKSSIPKNKKKRFVLRKLSKNERNAILTGGAALGGIGLGAVLASAFTFPSADAVNNNMVEPILNQDIDNDGILNDVDDDIDGDGILNQSDTDMDGDGLENSVDDDIDGDGILNEDDDHSPNYETPEPPVVIYTEAPFADLELDELSFGKAFAQAREEIGAGGFFEWRGDLYNTYQKEEWDALSEEQQGEFMASLVKNSNFHAPDTLDDDLIDIVDIIDEVDDGDIIEEDADVVINGDDDVSEGEEVVVDEIDDMGDEFDTDIDDIIDDLTDLA